MKKSMILLLLLSLIAVGCHTSRETAKVPEVAPSAAEAQPPLRRNYTVMNFEGTVEGVNMSGQFRVAEDSVMWVTVNKIIEMGRAMCTPDSLWLRAPLLGHDDALDYPALKQLTGVDITYDEMQQIALAPNAEERLSQLARRLGFEATIHITQRQRVEHLTFPYNKPVKR